MNTPAATTCRLTAEAPCARAMDGAPDCGEAFEHLPPLAPAEELCINALLGARERLSSAPDGEKLTVRRWRELALAGFTLETALSPAITDTKANGLFDEAGELLGRLVDTDDQFFETFVRAALLEIHLPAFAARRRNRPPTKPDLAHMHSSVSDLTYTLLEDTDDHLGQPVEHIAERGHTPCLHIKGDQQGHLAKLAFHLLSLREGLVLYPSTSREDHGEAFNLRHDGSFLTQESSKIPIKIQSAKRRDSKRTEYDGHIIVARYQERAGLAKHQIGSEQYPETGAELAQQSAFWLAREAAGGQLPKRQRKLLDRMGQHLRDNTASSSAAISQLLEKYGAAHTRR